MKGRTLKEKLAIMRLQVHATRQEAFVELYDIYVADIFRFIYYQVRTKEIAEDIVSDTFLKVWQYVSEQGRTVRNFRAILYRIARNTIIDHYRRAHQTELALETAYDIPSDIQVEGTLDIKLEIEKITVHLDKLNAEAREVIILKYVNDLSAKDIAEVLDKTPENVRVIAHRAIKELQKLIEVK